MVVRLNNYDKYDVALFIAERGKARWSDLLKEFVENEKDKHISRQTLSNYLKELREDGILSKTIDTKTLALLHIIRPIYKVTKTGRKTLQKIANKKEIYSFLDSAVPEEIEKLREEIARMKRN
jgi:DNA-binding HxlR family transcriptional regulator